MRWMLLACSVVMMVSAGCRSRPYVRDSLEPYATLPAHEQSVPLPAPHRLWKPTSEQAARERALPQLVRLRIGLALMAFAQARAMDYNASWDDVKEAWQHARLMLVGEDDASRVDVPTPGQAERALRKAGLDAGPLLAEIDARLALLKLEQTRPLLDWGCSSLHVRPYDLNAVFEASPGMWDALESVFRDVRITGTDAPAPAGWLRGDRRRLIQLVFHVSMAGPPRWRDSGLPYWYLSQPAPFDHVETTEDNHTSWSTWLQAWVDGARMLRPVEEPE